ncbi:MAG: hypothetical protein OSA83_17520 [Pseudomonadales bacterium]|jgi:hypothetical protein|nr:hypothetical protein [Pseudomonadales bacterium]
MNEISLSEPITRAKDLAYVRMQAPDLAIGETFIEDFGLIVSARTSDAIYARGTDSPHHVYILHQGEPACRSIAFHMQSLDDLNKLHHEAGATAIEELDEPGGGHVVRLTDPLGFTVEAIFGMEELEPIDAGKTLPLNIDGQRNRVGRFADVKRGASTVKRIGHLVLECKQVEATYLWYWKHFGILRTDKVLQPSGADGMQFARLDKGLEYTDHHTIAFQYCIDGTERLQHVSFEVQNFDDVMIGHDHLLEAKRYKPVWGIGRHRLGGQIYDYWKDPWGRIHEHWADSDLLNVEYQATVQELDGARDYWGANQQPTMAYAIQNWTFTTVFNLLRIVAGAVKAKLTKG